MFESIKGKFLLRQSRLLANEGMIVSGTGETFDDTDDLIVTFITAGYYFAIVYQHLKKRDNDVDKLDWIVGNAIAYFIQGYTTNQYLQSRVVNIYLNARDNLCLDNDKENQMYEELITSYLHELYGKYITDDMLKRSITLSMLVPVYTKAVEIAKKIKL